MPPRQPSVAWLFIAAVDSQASNSCNCTAPRSSYTELDGTPAVRAPAVAPPIVPARSFRDRIAIPATALGHHRRRRRPAGRRVAVPAGWPTRRQQLQRRLPLLMPLRRSSLRPPSLSNVSCARLSSS